MNSDDSMMKKSDVAKYLQTSIKSIERFVASGALRCVKFSERCVRIRRADLQDFINRNLTGGNHGKISF